MARKICPDCRIEIDGGMAVIRSIAFQRVALCKPCAEDRGWIDPPTREELVIAEAARGVVEAETFANGVRR